MKKTKILTIYITNFLIVMIALVSSLAGQSTSRIQNDSALQIAENELEILMMSIASTRDESRMQLNREFTHRFGQVLKLEGAHQYPFDKLSAVSRLVSENGELRIYTWELDDIEGNIYYFGFASSGKEDEKVVVFEFKNNAGDTDNSEHKKLTSDNWYGALYYDLQLVETNKSSYYILLGINRRLPLIKERIVEIIYVDDELYFGKEVFNTGERIMKMRLVYKHSSETDMALLFQEDGLLVMDHLMPSSPAYKDKYEFYVPDLSFDAFKLKKGIWYFEEDYDAKLEKQTNDQFFEMELPKQKKVY